MRIAALLFVVALGACGGEMNAKVGDGGGDGPLDAGGTCPQYVVPSGTNLSSPKVPFKAQVMPIFAANCASAMCHGTNNGPTGGLFLGLESAHGSDAATVHAGIVGVPSRELPSMPYVTAGAPSQSYLMHKLDGDQCAFAGLCVFPHCGALMPNGSSTPLPVALRDTVRRWIAQGAPND